MRHHAAGTVLSTFALCFSSEGNRLFLPTPSAASHAVAEPQDRGGREHGPLTQCDRAGLCAISGEQPRYETVARARSPPAARTPCVTGQAYLLLAPGK